MILYKYVSHSAGMKIIENNSVGFSRPHDFNDPFELQASYPAETSTEKADAFSIFLNDLRHGVKKSAWAAATGILSLTRHPLNPLMWAHYGEEHRGMVIGFKVDSEVFTCEETNFVPVQYGNVIYTTTRPNSSNLSNPTETMEIGGTFYFPKGQLEHVQRLFLYKPMCWSYEEEVRVVKCLKGIEENSSIASGEFSEIDVGGRPIFLLELPENSIREVYIGVRSEIPAGNINGEGGFIPAVKELHPEARVFQCELSQSSWELVATKLE